MNIHRSVNKNCESLKISSSINYRNTIVISEDITDSFGNCGGDTGRGGELVNSDYVAVGKDLEGEL